MHGPIFAILALVTDKGFTEGLRLSSSTMKEESKL